MRVSHIRFIITIVAAAVAGAFLIRQSGLSDQLSSAAFERPYLVAGAITKLVALLVGAFVAARVTFQLGRDNAAYLAWLLLSAGLAAFATGQAILTWYQVLTGHSPFPSPADVAFMLAYPLLIASLFVFLRVYALSGFPMEGGRALTVVTVLASIAIAVPLLIPSPGSGGG